MARTVILGNGGFAKILQNITGGGCLDKDESVPSDAAVVIGVGDKDRRRELYEEYSPRVLSVIDGMSLACRGASAGVGLQVMAGVIIQPGCTIGENVLINFGALIDHDCNIGDHCVISPGAILCGSVTLGEGCFVGAGAIIIQGVTLPDETFVPAGTLVVSASDFRKPQRVVRGDRASKAMVGPDVKQELSEASIG